MFRAHGGEPPDASTLEIRCVLLATEGRAIPGQAIEFAARIARPARAPVNVFSVARIWGTSFGLPNPGLLPTRRDWDEQKTLVNNAVKALQRRGLESQGRVLATRKATRVSWGNACGSSASLAVFTGLLV